MAAADDEHPSVSAGQDYLSLLIQKLPPSLLEEHHIRLSIVGCGDPKMIASYKEHLGCPYPIYSDESKRAYEVLGMTKRTYDMGDTTPEYQKKGTLNTVVTSIGVRNDPSLLECAMSLLTLGCVPPHRASSRWANLRIREIRSKSAGSSSLPPEDGQRGATGWR